MPTLTHSHTLACSRHSGTVEPPTFTPPWHAPPPVWGFILLLLLPRYAQIKRASTDSARLGVAPERVCFYCFATDTHKHTHTQIEWGRLGRLACAHTAAFTRWIHHRGIKSAWTWNRNHLKQQSHPQGEGRGGVGAGEGAAVRVGREMWQHCVHLRLAGLELACFSSFLSLLLRAFFMCDLRFLLRVHSHNVYEIFWQQLLLWHARQSTSITVCT